MAVSRKGKANNKEQLIQEDSEDPWERKRHYKYDFQKATDEFTTKHLKENDIDEEFAQGSVVNPLYAPDGEVVDNPAYLVGYSRCKVYSNNYRVHVSYRIQTDAVIYCQSNFDIAVAIV